jgi:hypothetical protein
MSKDSAILGLNPLQGGLTAALCLQEDLEICRYWLDKHVLGSANQASAFKQVPFGKQAAATCGSGATSLGTQHVAQAPPTRDYMVPI